MTQTKGLEPGRVVLRHRSQLSHGYSSRAIHPTVDGRCSSLCIIVSCFFFVIFLAAVGSTILPFYTHIYVLLFRMQKTQI